VKTISEVTIFIQLEQGSPNYGPWAKCGPRSHVIRTAKRFFQWWNE